MNASQFKTYKNKYKYSYVDRSKSQIDFEAWASNRGFDLDIDFKNSVGCVKYSSEVTQLCFESFAVGFTLGENEVPF